MTIRDIRCILETRLVKNQKPEARSQNQNLEPRTDTNTPEQITTKDTKHTNEEPRNTNDTKQELAWKPQTRSLTASVTQITIQMQRPSR